MLFQPLGTILAISLTALTTFSTDCSIVCPVWATLIALQRKKIKKTKRKTEQISSTHTHKKTNWHQNVASFLCKKSISMQKQFCWAWFHCNIHVLVKCERAAGSESLWILFYFLEEAWNRNKATIHSAHNSMVMLGFWAFSLPLCLNTRDYVVVSLVQALEFHLHCTNVTHLNDTEK